MSAARQLEATLRASSFEQVRFTGDGLVLDLRRSAPLPPSPDRASAPADAAAAAPEATTPVRAPSLGRVELLVEAGADVSAGQVVARLQIHRRVVELEAPVAGRVAVVACEDGELVDHDTVLLEIVSG